MLVNATGVLAFTKSGSCAQTPRNGDLRTGLRRRGIANTLRAMTTDRIPLTKHQLDNLSANAIQSARMAPSDASLSRYLIYVDLVGGASGVVWTSRNGPRLFLADTAIRFARDTLGVPSITVELAAK